MVDFLIFKYKMQLNGSYSYMKEPDSWSEPLNLVKKKTKPVAVVAPSSVVDKNAEKYKFETVDSAIVINPSKLQLSPDISKPKLSGENDVSLCNSYDERSQTSPSHKNELSKENEDKVVDREDTLERTSGKNERNASFTETLTALQIENIKKNGFFSLFNDLASHEHTFLTALYMNSLLNVPHPNGLTNPFSSTVSDYLLNSGYHNSSMGSLPESSGQSGVGVTPAFNNLWTLADMQQRLWQMAAWQENQQQSSQSSNSTGVDIMPKIETSLGANCVEKSIPATLTTSSFEQSSSSSSNKIVSKKPKHCTKGSSSMDQKISTSSGADGTKTQESGQTSNNQDKKKPHIKKPLNAFMLYMKEMRAKVVAECTLKESAAINQILGRRWHALGREEQAKYYELARRERQLHMQLYPDWSSRANSSRGKKRKRKQETNDGGNSMKKCRARYGLDQQSQWCKPCRRKKKCIRYMESGDSVDGNQSEDNLGSCGSAGEAQTPPEEDSESLHHSLSSPGGLSGLSSLTSPSMILPSPSTSLASPSVSLASPCMSLQSPLTPHESSAFECKPSMNNLGVLSNHQPASSSSSTNAVGSSGALSMHHHHPSHHPPPPGPPLHRNPVGTNPHDINNPLSVNQLTGQCIKTENSSGNKDSSSNSRPVISVT